MKTEEEGATAAGTRPLRTPFFRHFATALPYVLTALFTLLLALVTARHEMWRDEIQAWLLARDSATFPALLHNLRYEGHPPLWHLLLWIPSRFTWNPAAMQVVHVLLAAATAFLVLRFAPFPLLVRAGLAAGYFFFYEWGVIARNYAAGALLFFAVCAMIPFRRRRFPWIALLLALLCHTSIHALILVLPLTAWLLWDHVTAAWGRSRDPDIRWRPFLAGLLLITAGLATAVVQVKPPADGGFAAGWNFKWEGREAKHVAETIVYGWLPLPEDRLNYWNSNRILDGLPPPSPKLSFWAEPRVRMALAALAFGALFFLSRPIFLLPFLAGTAGLELFFYCKYYGSCRHHGFLFLWFIVLLWISAAAPRRPWRWRRLEPAAAWWHRHRIWLLLPLLAVHAWGTWIAARQDWKQIFSNGKTAAEQVRKELAKNDLLVIGGDESFVVSTVVGYARLPRVHYLDRGETGSYILWDRNRGRNRRETLRDVLEKDPRDALLILSHPVRGSRFSGHDVVPLPSFATPSVAGENIHLYLVRNPYRTPSATPSEK